MSDYQKHRDELYQKHIGELYQMSESDFQDRCLGPEVPKALDYLFDQLRAIPVEDLISMVGRSFSEEVWGLGKALENEANYRVEDDLYNAEYYEADRRLDEMKAAC